MDDGKESSVSGRVSKYFVLAFPVALRLVSRMACLSERGQR